MMKTILALLAILVAISASGSLAGENATSGSSNALIKTNDFLKEAINNSGYMMTMPDFININKNKTEASGWIVVDVRPREVYPNGHIPAAISIPLADLIVKMNTIPGGKKIAVYCCSDIDAAFGAMTLRVFADREAWVLQGGLSAWNSAGMKQEYSLYK
jgi:rhodanese-related sulfurtransferase